MEPAIFISYRRDDAEGEAGRLFDDLTRAFGNGFVFMDVSGIRPGVDFRRAIDENVSACGVLLAVVGPGWATITNAAGQRRLEDENDFVRLEIASALKRSIPVIPVLVHDARMPHPDQLPENLQEFAYRNSVEISHARWNSDVQLLVDALREYVQVPAANGEHTVHATVPVQLPPPAPASRSPRPDQRGKWPLYAGVLVAVLVVLGSLGAFLLRGSRSPQPKPSQSVAAQMQSSDPFAGSWVNPSPEGQNGLARLEITGAGEQRHMHAWGSCSPNPCDWGTVAATMHTEGLVGTFQLGDSGGVPARRALVLAVPSSPGLLVTVQNEYANHAPTRHAFRFQRSQ